MHRFPLLAVIAVAVITGCDGTPATPTTAGNQTPADAAAPVAQAEPAAATPAPPTSPPSPDPTTMSSQSPPPGDVPAVELRNRLGDETSPYLLQHKSNPVAWFAWGPEAFEAARALNRPIFLSVGYSTCYWCHVMERESFENDEIAAIMNEHFICIKVDREERPDVDDLYMAAVQMLTGHGGWPMSVFIEPESLRPFLGGTYFPPQDAPGRPGFPTVLRQVADFWANKNDVVRQQADRVAEAVAKQLAADTTPVAIDAGVVELAMSQLLASYDSEHGGFGGSPQKAPKFPMPATLDFMIGAGWDAEATRSAVVHTLDRMATGGMYDQVGGGFHRYSTDRQWLVPHFEKMLYDNGQLASTYADVYERTSDAFYAEIIRETLDYVLREMTSPDGAFLSAQDAEVNHREGENYLWLETQLRETLEAAGHGDLVEFALAAYGLDKGTNFRDPHHPEDGDKNVVFLVDRPDRLAQSMDLEPAEVDERLRRINAALLEVRDTRDQPITDDKILASWNGLMIAGFADGGRVLSESRYVEAAARAADWILAEMRDGDGGLLRTARGGEARIPAFLEDYACMVRGLIALYRAGRDRTHLLAALELVDEARRRFWDEQGGGYFDTLPDQSDLFVRSRATYDGAVPCGNSVMLNNLLDLHELGPRPDDLYLDDAVATLQSLSQTLKTRPTGPVLTTLALHRLLESNPERVAGAAPPPAVATGGGGGQAEPAPTRPGLTGEKIRVRAEPRMVKIADGGEGAFEIRVEIGHGWHVNAHKPGIDYLVPLTVTLVGGGGLELVPQYPAGEKFQGPEGAMIVHHGAVAIPVTVKRTGRITGQPRIMLGYQMCDDKICLAPEQKRVPVAIVEE